MTHDSIQLEWTKPEQGACNINAYTVFYSELPNQWNPECKVKCTTQTMIVSELSESTI